MREKRRGKGRVEIGRRKREENDEIVEEKEITKGLKRDREDK